MDEITRQGMRLLTIGDIESMLGQTGNSFLNIKQVTRRLNVSSRTVHDLKDRGEIGFVRVGRRVLFRPEDVDSFITRKLKRPSHLNLLRGRAPVIENRI